ncbi:MAG: haloacid dehalogenase-like hydrolase, partial [bacterium]|nr:haloacid dehalogenase-like hydrolase [bacterium]
YLMKVVEVFYRRIRGCSVHDVEYVGRLVAAEQREQVYVYTRELVAKYRDTHQLVAITGSPDVVAKPFAESWGFVRVYPSNLVVKDGVYSGDREPLMDAAVDISEFKRGLLQDAMRELGVTLEGSVGVGDTESDVAFLESVETPIAFNPNVHLVRIARAHGWEMVYERKDAIIHLIGGQYSIEGVE